MPSPKSGAWNHTDLYDTTPPAEQRDELIDRAVAAGGAHCIKFTEVCLREYAVNPNPLYLVAARDVPERVGPS